LFQILLKRRSVAGYTPDHEVAAQLFFAIKNFVLYSEKMDI